jgi:hypothetical protein
MLKMNKLALSTIAKTTRTVIRTILGGEIIQTSPEKKIATRANLLVLANNISSLNRIINLAHQDNSKELTKVLA